MPDDFIDTYLDYTDGTPTNTSFRLWSGIGVISACLERRIWANTARSQVFPNLFILLVAPPSIGKSEAIKPAQHLLRQVKLLKLASDSVTGASFADELADAYRKLVLPDGKLVDYHFLSMILPEFSVLFSTYDLALMGKLTFIWDCPSKYSEKRRTKDLKLDVFHPGLTMLAGTQPEYLGSIMPAEAWGQGFAARLLMIYSGESVKVSIFNSRPVNAASEAWLLARMEHMMSLHGEVTWTLEVKEKIEALATAGIPPTPKHPRLVNYSGRRILTLLKLSMLACVSRGEGLEVAMPDLDRALAWMLGAEQKMPDVFRAMGGLSDKSILQELHIYIWQVFTQSQQPVHEKKLFTFLQSKAPSDRIPKLIESLERAGAVERVAGTTLFRPLAWTGEDVDW